MFQVIRSKDCLNMEGLHEVANFKAKDKQMRKLLGLLVLVSGMAISQEMDTVTLDTMKKVPTYFGGVFLEMGGKMAPNPPGVSLTQFIGAGIQYNKWSLGFLVNDFKGTTQRFLIFPNGFELEYKYGGPVVGFSYLQTRWIEASIQTSYSLGDMTWRNIVNQEDFIRSEFSLFAVSTKLEFIRLRYVRPYFNLGYQQMSGLNLAGVENADFSGFFLGLGLRLGYFNQ